MTLIWKSRRASSAATRAPIAWKVVGAKPAIPASRLAADRAAGLLVRLEGVGHLVQPDHRARLGDRQVHEVRAIWLPSEVGLEVAVDHRDRDHGLDLLETAHRLRAAHQPGPQGAGERGQDDVVDGAAVLLADLLVVGQRGADGDHLTGALAERALLAVLPDVENWPYTMRVVSDILESNGSSSMATVCGASLSLMDAGVPLASAVAGVAMGLVKEEDSYAILTDIAGAEDHYGDMDFKVAGTRKGITALQMDIKVMGITSKIMHEALEQAKRGRLYILDKMEGTITTGRENISAFAPRIYTLQIPVDKIRDLIGPGGKMIRSIIEETGVKIDVDDSGRVNVASNDGPSAQRAIQRINDLTAVPEVGKTYLGKVVRLAEFGAFVEIIPGTDGLLHISEIAEHRVKEVKDELKEGDQVLVKVLGIEGNRIKLSRKAILREQRAKMAPQGGEGDGGPQGEGSGGEGGERSDASSCSAARRRRRDHHL